TAGTSSYLIHGVMNLKTIVYGTLY
ncbi:hypothetical protein EVA_20634, partial [gut metagenome]